METGIVLIHFGEPPSADPTAVQRYLTRIFLQNAELESSDAMTERERAEELAARRAPGLIAEYEGIGGSPLNAQARAQAADLERTLADRGHDVEVAVAFQFVDPTIADVLAEFADAGLDRVVALPVYPLCGPSTTVAALETVERELSAASWDPEYTAVSGWHRHPDYLRLRADRVSTFARTEGIDLHDEGTTVLFSAHGTPMQYVESGSRYVQYVEETCEAIAALLDVESFALGYQNHANRDVEWTPPDVEDRLATIDAERVVVEPVSFLHEQSETLVELDEELAGEAHDRGIDFHRVPIPHDDPSVPAVLADVIEPSIAGIDPQLYQLRPCACASGSATLCLNAPGR